MRLGCIRLKDFLDKTGGEVRGRIIADAKKRHYTADYEYRQDNDGCLWISRKDGGGTEVQLKPTIELDESLVSFFGFYSGDGVKGSESREDPGRVRPPISVSQRETNLTRFSAQQLRRLFLHAVHFDYSLGEDSAYFLAGKGWEELANYYGGSVSGTPPLSQVKPELTDRDREYLRETRNVPWTNEEYLAFYYFHKSAMEDILSDVKRRELDAANITLDAKSRVKASLRRPFIKGTRTHGGSSRADELIVKGLSGFGELFLKMLHEIEDSILHDRQTSTQGLVVWEDVPSEVGEQVDIQEFFRESAYGSLAGERPEISARSDHLRGRWPRSKTITLRPKLRVDPLWCYTSGLYLAEGSTKKALLFSMFRNRPGGMSLGFTSSENTSLELMLRALNKLFTQEDCLQSWKVKAGSQYFPELVVVGLKNGVPMLRGGSSGDGKLRTMEISLAVKEWALEVAPSLLPYGTKYSHVEPTGAGVPRIDFSASSVLCKWYFPLVIYASFGGDISDPVTGFTQ